MHTSWGEDDVVSTKTSRVSNACSSSFLRRSQLAKIERTRVRSRRSLSS